MGIGPPPVRRQLTPGLISSLPETAGLTPFISFSTSYPELLDSVVRRLVYERLTSRQSLDLKRCDLLSGGLSLPADLISLAIDVLIPVTLHEEVRGPIRP